MRGTTLFQLYTIFIRPVIETNSIVYHPMLSKYQAQQIERMQKLVTRLCFGFDKPYEQACREQDLLTLATRRKNAIKKFTARALKNDKFAPKWFVPRQETGHNLRNPEPYEVRRTKTERYKNSPLMNIRRTANEITMK